MQFPANKKQNINRKLTVREHESRVARSCQVIAVRDRDYAERRRHRTSVAHNDGYSR